MADQATPLEHQQATAHDVGHVPADDFAQTGPQQDDLFDDVVPAAEAMRLRSDEDLFNDDFTPVAEPIVEAPTPAPQPSAQRSTRSVRGQTESPRARGRGRGRGPSSQGASNGQGRARAHPQSQSQSNAPENAPSGPRKETVFAVRGDRHATGGIRKPKLTEEELAEKVASMQIKNATIAAAHARAEADAASFAEREQQAKQVAEQKRKEERRDRQQMMGEREKNRQRKLKAMTGREWDAEKDEGDFAKGGRFDKRSGVTDDRDHQNDGREYLYQEPRAGKRNEGRGSGRGGHGGRGQEQATPRKDDFPALPTKDANSTSVPGVAEIKGLPAGGEGKSWAEQVEASTQS